MYPSLVPQFLGPMSELVVLPLQHFILKKCCSGWLGMWEVTFTWYRFPETSPVCFLGRFIKELKGGGGDLITHEVLVGPFDRLKYFLIWSCRVRVTQLWLCVLVGCGNGCAFQKDRSCKPWVCVVDSNYLNSALFDRHNVLTAHINSVFSEMLVSTFGACASQDKVYRVVLKVKLYI